MYPHSYTVKNAPNFHQSLDEKKPKTTLDEDNRLRWHDSFYAIRQYKRLDMALEYPFDFTLENGTDVTVKRIDQKNFEFILKKDDGGERRFTYNDDVEFTTEMEEGLDFDQLNVLRRFWLEREKDEL